MLKISLVIIFIVSICNNTFASSYIDIYKTFKRGDYLSALNKIKTLKSKDSTTYYLKGLCLSRLQQHDKAIISLRKSIQLKSDSKDIHFELGQSLYAANELLKARNQFTKSYKRKFKRPTSLYYMGYISQTLEQYKKSKLFYSKLLKIKNLKRSLKQSATFQRANVLLEIARKKANTSRYIKKYILPQLRNSLKIDTETKIAKNIKKKIFSLESEFGLDPNKYQNGVPIPKKRYSVAISQGINYDNNVSYSSDSPVIEATQSDSFIYETSLFSDYLFTFNRNYFFSPQISYQYIKHSNRENTEVFVNDYYQLLPKLSFGYQHKISKKRATLTLSYEYGYKERDRESKEDLIFYSRHNSITLKDSFNIFSFGESSLMYTYKSNSSWDKLDDYTSNAITLDQLYTNERGHTIYALYQRDSVDMFNSESESTVSNYLRVDYIATNLIKNYSFDLALSLTFLSYGDKTTAKSTGTEKTITPSFKVTKNVSNKLAFSIEYSYSSKSSLFEANEYTKKVTSTNLKYNF